MSEETVVTAAEPKAEPVADTQGAAPADEPVAKPAGEEAPRRRSSDTVVDKEGNVIVRKDSYTKDEMAAIVKAAKKNARYTTKREIEAFYQGRESAAPRPVEKPAPIVEDKPPTREQYESYEAFLDAKAEYTGKRAAHEYRTKAEAEQKQRAAQEAQAERVKSFQSKVNEKYPDLAERAESIAHVQMPDGMGEAISESELGPDILNHFAENPKDFERIAALSPSAAIREVGKLEARLEGAAKPAATAAAEPKKPSAAPAPLKPVGGTAVLGDGEPSHDNPDAWRAWRDRQVAAKKRPAAQVK